jgi:DNA repair protein RecN (Recombination protein N)
MIKELHLEKFLFIHESHLEFCPSLNVITGETGAGKSIMLEAVKLLLGKKARSGLVLPGSPGARIQALFDIAQVPAAREFLQNAGLINEDEPNSLLIARTFRQEGAEKIFVNGLMTTVSVLKDLGRWLMEIHGQNEHQTLTEPKIQRRLVDRMGGEAMQKKLRQVAEQFAARKALIEELAMLEQRLKDSDSRLEELMETQKALRTLALSCPEEEQQLKDEANSLEHFEQISAELTLCEGAFSGAEQVEGVVALLHRSREALKRVAQHESEIGSLWERLESLYQEALDIRNNLSRKIGGMEYDPERLSFLQSRLSDIARACRRYKTDAAGLITLQGDIEREMTELASPDSTLEKKRRELADVEAAFQLLLKQVSQERHKLAARLEKLVAAEMQALGFAAGHFSIAFAPAEPGPEGDEAVEFMVSLNPGAPGGPLRKIASGGELSRVALALKSVLAKGDEMPSMVFDEIDTGIGGETAMAVAKSLGKLGKTKQVILVTHLHQIAKEGTCHFTVSKKVEKETTRVDITEISGKQREREIARMLGQTDEEGLSFARSMLKEKAADR